MLKLLQVSPVVVCQNSGFPVTWKRDPKTESLLLSSEETAGRRKGEDLRFRVLGVEVFGCRTEDLSFARCW